MATQIQKEDDYSLLVTNTLPTGGTISRLFNFAAQQVTTVFSEKAEMRAGYSDGGVSVALTAQMQIQKFSEFDTQAEIEIMHGLLVHKGGHPPALEAFDKPKAAVAKLG